MEKWKDIPEYEGIIQVSNYGNIKRLDSYISNGRFIKEYLYIPQKSSDGYLHVLISVNGKRKFLRTGRMVGELFVDNPFNLKEIDHIDQDKTNDYYKNIRWVTRKENNQRISGYNCVKYNKNEYFDIMMRYNRNESINSIAKLYSTKRHNIRSVIYSKVYKNKYNPKQLILFENILN